MAEVKRGFRKVTVILPVKDHEALVRQAEMNDREPGQQAAFLLKRALASHQTPGLVDQYDDQVQAALANGAVEFVPDPTLDGDLVLKKSEVE